MVNNPRFPFFLFKRITWVRFSDLHSIKKDRLTESDFPGFPEFNNFSFCMSSPRPVIKLIRGTITSQG